MVLGTSLAILLAMAGAPDIAQASPPTPPKDTARCERLAAYYDRHSVRFEGSLRNGQIDRVIGLQYCREGKIAEGEKMLENAIQSLGFTPPD